MELNSVSGAASTGTSPLSSNAESARSISSDFETFLKMLTVQLENQDPLSPVKSEEFAVQLATFSGVEQQVQTNQLLSEMISQTTLSGVAEYARWVGMEARAAVAAPFDGSPVQIAPMPDLHADSASLVVRNQFGSEVERFPIDVSHSTMEWDGQLDTGPAPYGNYTFSVESYSNGEMISDYAVEVYSSVQEVRALGEQTTLIMEGGVEVLASQVRGLREPA